MYGVLGWTPETFWKMSLPEYVDAMAAYRYYETLKNKQNKTDTSLSKDEADHLKDLLAKDKQQNAEQQNQC